LTRKVFGKRAYLHKISPRGFLTLEYKYSKDSLLIGFSTLGRYIELPISGTLILQFWARADVNIEPATQLEFGSHSLLVRRKQAKELALNGSLASLNCS